MDEPGKPGALVASLEFLFNPSLTGPVQKGMPPPLKPPSLSLSLSDMHTQAHTHAQTLYFVELQTQMHNEQSNNSNFCTHTHIFMLMMCYFSTSEHLPSPPCQRR